jgi:hypothetical protein
MAAQTQTSNSEPERTGANRRKQEMRISQDGHLVTLINVFETTPEQQQVLIEHWTRFAETVKDEPGFIGRRCTKAPMAHAS